MFLQPKKDILDSSRKCRSFTKGKMGSRSNTILIGSVLPLHLPSGKSLESCCNLASSLQNNCSPEEGERRKKESSGSRAQYLTIR